MLDVVQGPMELHRPDDANIRVGLKSFLHIYCNVERFGYCGTILPPINVEIAVVVTVVYS